MFIGHKNEKNEIQALHDHLANVSKMAGEFSAAFGADSHARRIGLLHDAGKYSVAAQKRLADPEHSSKVDHSTAGAKIALEKCRDGAGAIAIAGHHGGIPDLGGRMASNGDGTLMGRMKKDLSGNLDYSAFWQENEVYTGNLLPQLMPMLHPVAIPIIWLKLIWRQCLKESLASVCHESTRTAPTIWDPALFLLPPAMGADPYRAAMVGKCANGGRHALPPSRA